MSARKKELSPKQQLVVDVADNTMKAYFIFATCCLITADLEKEGSFKLPDGLPTVLTTIGDWPWNYVDCTDIFGAIFNIYNGDKSERGQTYLRVASNILAAILTSIYLADQDDVEKARWSSHSFGITMLVSSLPYLKDLYQKATASVCKSKIPPEAKLSDSLLGKKSGPSWKASAFNSLLWVSSGFGAFARGEHIHKSKPLLAKIGLYGGYGMGSLCRLASFFPQFKPTVVDEPIEDDNAALDKPLVADRGRGVHSINMPDSQVDSAESSHCELP